jgi:hypothetical protein
MNRRVCRTKPGSSRMIVGDPSIFAIESGIMQAYEELSLRALGFFVIHVLGRSYGYKKPDATHLAIAYDGVLRRIESRGNHQAPIVIDAPAPEIAIAIGRENYIGPEENELFFGMTADRFGHSLYSNGHVWAPDGEQGFDDGSSVLQFEAANRVRLVAFQREDYSYIPESLRDLWLPADDFYDVLKEWRVRFEAEWEALPKEPAHVTVFPCR